MSAHTCTHVRTQAFMRPHLHPTSLPARQAQTRVGSSDTTRVLNGVSRRPGGDGSTAGVTATAAPFPWKFQTEKDAVLRQMVPFVTLALTYEASIEPLMHSGSPPDNGQKAVGQVPSIASALSSWQKGHVSQKPPLWQNMPVMLVMRASVTDWTHSTCAAQGWYCPTVPAAARIDTARPPAPASAEQTAASPSGVCAADCGLQYSRAPTLEPPACAARPERREEEGGHGTAAACSISLLAGSVRPLPASGTSEHKSSFAST